MAIIAAVGPRKTIIGRIPIHLQNAPIAVEMAGDTFARPAILETVGDHRRTVAAEGPVISGVSPEIGCLGAAGARHQSRQRGFVGEDPLGLFDQREDMFGEDIEFKSEPAHPLRHQGSVEVHLVAGVNRFLAVERQAVGIF